MKTKLTLIKLIHTLIWVFINFVIFYMFYAVIIDKLDNWFWIGYELIILEGIIFLIFKLFCPVKVLARKYSDSTKDNFEIYPPNWLAKHNKSIYTGIMVIILAITANRLHDCGIYLEFEMQNSQKNAKQ